jgi:hypothetical protein
MIYRPLGKASERVSAIELGGGHIRKATADGVDQGV